MGSDCARAAAIGRWHASAHLLELGRMMKELRQLIKRALRGAGEILQNLRPLRRTGGRNCTRTKRRGRHSFGIPPSGSRRNCSFVPPFDLLLGLAGQSVGSLAEHREFGWAHTHTHILTRTPERAKACESSFLALGQQVALMMIQQQGGPNDGTPLRRRALRLASSLVACCRPASQSVSQLAGQPACC